MAFGTSAGDGYTPSLSLSGPARKKEEKKTHGVEEEETGELGGRRTQVGWLDVCSEECHKKVTPPLEKQAGGEGAWRMRSIH